MAQLRQLAGPVMRAAARFQHHPARRLRGKERQQLGSADLLAQQSAARRIRAMHLKNRLCDIKTNYANL
jgi:hypothetical protein